MKNLGCIRMRPVHWFVHLLIYITVSRPIVFGCNRTPPGTNAAKSPADENYAVVVAGNTQYYIPGQKYNVSLVAYGGETFQSFTLGLESENGENVPDGLGSFEISDYAETRFSPRCVNLIENTNTNTKTRIDVTWMAPLSTGKGCILIRATVAQHRDVWFMDDGLLTKKICEEEVDDIDSQPSIMDPCCACDEAKYELTFEGKWSRHTHPKDFPANSWRTRFSDIIGASHTLEYRFWQYGELASEGLREVSEHGSTRTLESELKDQSEQIRTIIKARGIAYPNVTGKTFAVFRVDSKHHLISLVSMIDPSPDWIVGVSGLELCLPNCSWIESKIHNLYPWDAGTDSGPSYMSADQPQVPPDFIRRIKSNFPNDPRSPFYDPSGAPMKPLATLHINRRRLYEKTCESTDDENNPPECSTNPWSRWNDCSAKCGPGKQYRTREFKNPTLARRSKCRNSLREEENCVGKKCGAINEDETAVGEAEVVNPGAGAENPECAVSEWSDWSTCSATCGAGVVIRSRHYLNPRAKKKCQRVSRVKLQETRKCEGPECGGEIGNGNNEKIENGANGGEENQIEGETAREQESNFDENYPFQRFESYSQKLEEIIPPECGVTPWSDFTPCIGPCGSVGQRQRERKIWNKHEVYGIKPPNAREGYDPCRHIKRHEYVNCTNPSCNSIVPSYCYEDIKVSPCRDSDMNNYWYYDHMSDQCAIYWADKCDKNRNKFDSKEACEATCQQPRHAKYQSDDLLRDLPIGLQKEDCLVSDWMAHSCNATCGEGIQIKTRKVLRSPKYGGKVCPKHLVRLDRCYQRCDDMYSVSGVGEFSERRRINQLHAKPAVEKADECRYSEWTAWTPCTASCGDNAVRQKTRTLLNNNGLNYKCKDRVRIEKCVLMPCLLDSNDEEDRW